MKKEIAFGCLGLKLLVYKVESNFMTNKDSNSYTVSRSGFSF